MHSRTAVTLKTLTSLTIGGLNYQRVAYVAPPPGATRGVISNACDETPAQLYQDLVRRNPEYTILAARRMGKTYSILITFDANEVPHSSKYMGAIHRCTPYRGNPDACTNCRQPAYRTGSCKGRNLRQPWKQTKQPQTQQRELVPHGDNFPQLSPGPTQPTQHKRAWTVPLNKGWGPPPPSSKHASSLTTTSTLQGDLAKSREEAAAAKAEAQAARAEAAALREHIAKLEAQITTLATGLPAPPIPTPNGSQPPPPNPPTAPDLPNHLNPDIYVNSLDLQLFIGRAEVVPARRTSISTEPAWGADADAGGHTSCTVRRISSSALVNAATTTSPQVQCLVLLPEQLG
ncbi:hypothetical protein HPB50_029434 [Hyalomma asiaticum]|nr:hypothetical protein HPB50_029434 [Hyalomma asiaticum]